MTPRRRTLVAVAAVVAALALYLALWPVPIAPVAWDAPRAPTDPAFAPNDGFRGLQRLGVGAARGAEAIAVDPETGDVYTGTRDGLVLRLHVRTGVVGEVARTGGRPLGLAFDRAGDLYVCDAEKGLLRVAHVEVAGAIEREPEGAASRPGDLGDDAGAHVEA